MRILISGAGVAGLAGAHTLSSSGHHITIVERAEHPRVVGAPIDIRGDAISVADEMGILDELTARQVAVSEGTYFINNDGTPVAKLGGETFHETDEDIEVPREDVCQVLTEGLKPSVEMFYGDSIRSLHEDDEGIDVTFASGVSGRYDVLVGADGLHSLTRKLTFAPEEEFIHHLGFYAGYTWLPHDGRTRDGGEILNWPGHNVGVVSYKDATLGHLQFRAPWIDYDYHDIGEQRQILLTEFADHAEWRVPELLDNVRHDPNLYFDSVSQIYMNTWYQGRVVLLGDAAHCASALSGRGTSLALTGADALSRALVEQPDDLPAAFSHYEFLQRPYVTYAQDIAVGGGDRLIPVTQVEIDTRNEHFSRGEAQ